MSLHFIILYSCILNMYSLTYTFYVESITWCIVCSMLNPEHFGNVYKGSRIQMHTQRFKPKSNVSFIV